MSTQIARDVARLVLAGVWREGATLPREVELASASTFSRASIREALSLLKAKGLIASKQKAGTHVRARIDWNMFDAELLDWTLSKLPTQEFANQLVEIRGIVEPALSAHCAAPMPYHRAVLHAIWARDPNGARQAMHKLMDFAEQNIISARS